MKTTWIALWLATSAAAGAAQTRIAEVSAPERAAWIDHLLPLPHEVSIPRKAVLRPGDVKLTFRPNAGEVEQQARRELLALFQQKAGAKPDGAGFEICIGVLDAQGRLCGAAVPHAARLKSLPHPAQAYLVQPLGDAKLAAAALAPAGVYYAAQTLKQLLAAKLSKDRIEIPLAEITDWPDLDERGLWNFDLDLIPWIASLKMNFAKVPGRMERIRRGQPVRAWPARSKRFPNVLKAAAARAVKAVPNVTHLNYIGAKLGGYDAYPELAGKGDEAVPKIWYKPRRIRVPCAACPVLKRLIAEYIMCLAAAGAQEVSVWLSEFKGQCQCPACRKAGQLRMETRAAVDGWRLAREKYPHLVLRIFYCMGGKSLDDTYQVLKELPPEVKIERCYGQYGEAFDRIAAEGRWVGSYAGVVLTRAEYSGLRFYGPPAIRRRVGDLLKRHWSAMYSINYVYSAGAYQRGLFDFHVCALAEWSWNLKGRDTRALARAWATRRGCARPDRVGDWAAVMARLEHAIAPAIRSRAWSKLPAAIRSRQKLEMGKGLLSGFCRPTAYARQLDACQRALSIAQAAGEQDLALETQYARALVQAVAALNGVLAGRSSRAALARLKQASEEMIRTFDARMDLLRAEPRSFAAATKKKHADLWRRRVLALQAAATPSQ